MTDLMFTFLFLIAALNGFAIGAMWRQSALIRLRAERDSWERQARQLAARFQPMPRMGIEWRDSIPVLMPDDVGWPEDDENWVLDEMPEVNR